MAEHILFAGWRGLVPGREKQALALGQKVGELLTKMGSDGLIEGLNTYQLDPHGGDLNMFMIITGESEKLAQVKQNPQFRECVIEANYCLEGYGLVDGVTGETGRNRTAILAKLFND